MYTIDIILRGNPLSLSIQRKEEASALALFREVFSAMGSGQSRPLELTCEKMAEKRVALMSGDIAAVQLNSAVPGGSPMGMRSGFFSVPEEA